MIRGMSHAVKSVVAIQLTIVATLVIICNCRTYTGAVKSLDYAGLLEWIFFDTILCYEGGT